jgi:hypothetical protein
MPDHAPTCEVPKLILSYQVPRCGTKRTLKPATFGGWLAVSPKVLIAVFVTKIDEVFVCQDVSGCWSQKTNANSGLIYHLL